MKKRVLILSFVAALIIGGAFAYYMFHIPTTSEEVMDMIVRKNNNAVISVGIWEDGKETKYQYTKEGKQEFVKHKYQVGSVTKTFTGAILAKEIKDGNVSLKDQVGKYLELKNDSYNPTFEKLVTHRSGLSTLWDDLLTQSDDIFEEKYSRDDMVQLLGSSEIKNDEYGFDYSNFGTGLVGTAIANEIDPNSSYQEAMNSFIKERLDLPDTQVGGTGDFENNYKWNDQDEMMAAGAIVSTVPDLIEYGKLYLSADAANDYLDLCLTPLESVDENYDIGYFWIIDKSTGIAWHNGEIAYENEAGKEVGYQAFLGIDKGRNKIVVVLYNGISYFGDNALTDLLGMRLMEE